MKTKLREKLFREAERRALSKAYFYEEKLKPRASLLGVRVAVKPRRPLALL